MARALGRDVPGVLRQEYGVFGVFLDAGPGEDLDLIMPKSEFDPEQFDYPSCSFGYGVNGGSSAHPGIHAEQIGQTDRIRTISLSWDVPVSQISYLRSPVECVEKRAAVDHLSGAPAAFPLWSGGNSHLALYDSLCAEPGDRIIRLNHTISGGKLDQICSVGAHWLMFDIVPESAGELVVDIPKDVFPPHHGGFDHPSSNREPRGIRDDYPFTVITWGRSWIPSSIGEFHHAESL